MDASPKCSGESLHQGRQAPDDGNLRWREDRPGGQGEPQQSRMHRLFGELRSRQGALLRAERARTARRSGTSIQPNRRRNAMACSVCLAGEDGPTARASCVESFGRSRAAHRSEAVACGRSGTQYRAMVSCAVCQLAPERTLVRRWRNQACTTTPVKQPAPNEIRNTESGSIVLGQQCNYAPDPSEPRGRGRGARFDATAGANASLPSA